MQEKRKDDVVSCAEISLLGACSVSVCGCVSVCGAGPPPLKCLGEVVLAVAPRLLWLYVLGIHHR